VRTLVVAAALIASLACQDTASKATVEIAVRVAWPGAAPSVVDDNVVMPIEEALSDLPGLVYLHSVARDGEAEVRVGVERAKGEDLVRSVFERVNQLDERLPTSADFPTVHLLDAEERRTVTVSVEAATAVELRAHTDRLIDELARHPGVREVTVCGGAAEEKVVELDPARLAARELTAAEVLTALGGTCPAEDVPVAGLSLRLADIARVERRAVDARCTATLAGRPVAVIELGLARGADIEAAIAELQRAAPPDLVIAVGSAEVVIEDSRPRWSQGVWPPERPGDAGSPLAIDVDRPRVAEAGVPMDAMNRTMQLATAGERVGDCRLLIAGGTSPAALADLRLRGQGGTIVRLGDLVSFETGPPQGPILRLNRLRVDQP
jgi:multidrug efflux pump subunit AcrB